MFFWSIWFNFLAVTSMSNAAARPNFLLIIVDDLRTALGCYGDIDAYTPNIDALAEDSIVFTEAFAQQALCAPSRNSFLTSRRPDTLQLYDFYNYWRDRVGNYTTLPQHLKDNGYTTMSIGKVFHPGISSNGSDDSPYSWTEKPFHPYTDRYKNAPVCKGKSGSEAAINLVCPVNVSTMPNRTLPDIEALREARRFIRRRRKDADPFFLAVGFQKPHVPLKYPERYLKYHPVQKIHIPEPYEWPENVSSVAYNPWTDLRWREDVARLRLKFPWGKIPRRFGKLIIQSYYAAVSYLDNLIGKLMHQLRASRIREDTIVMLTSDHGWALGEHATWSKYSNFDVATHVPLMISIPGLTFNAADEYRASGLSSSSKSANGTKMSNDKVGREINSEYTVDDSEETGVSARRYERRKCKKAVQDGREKSRCKRQRTCQVTSALVELVDIFPTIADLAGIPIPICQVDGSDHRLDAKGTFSHRGEPISLCSEGISLLPLIKDTLKCQNVPWKKAAFSQYPRPGVEPTLHPNSDKPHLKEINVMGYTLKSNDYRYTAWVPFAHETCRPDWDVILAEELYDHRIDRRERFNVASSPGMIRTKQYLGLLLRNGWRNALPTY